MLISWFQNDPRLRGGWLICQNGHGLMGRGGGKMNSIDINDVSNQFTVKDLHDGRIQFQQANQVVTINKRNLPLIIRVLKMMGEMSKNDNKS